MDTHYANALYSFLKERVITFGESVAMVSSYANCVREPGTAIVAVSRGKKVIVGLNQTFVVSNHDYSKVSMIPGVTFIKDISDANDDSWY